MERRDFISISMVGAGVSLAAPGIVLAGKAGKMAMAGGVFYTKDAPGRWSKKVAGHLPSIEVEKSSNKAKIKVVTSHEMKGFEHYIVKHVLLDQDYNFMDERMFDPTTQKIASSIFEVSNYRGPIYALSLCNKHDLWLNAGEI
jgi:superoxide reductase